MAEHRNTFDYCKTLNGTCSCERGGEALCSRMTREAGDEGKLREAQEKREAEDTKRQSKYIKDDERPFGGRLTASMAQMIAAYGGRFSSKIPTGFFRPEVARPRSLPWDWYVPLMDETPASLSDGEMRIAELRKVRVNREWYERGQYLRSELEELYEFQQRYGEDEIAQNRWHQEVLRKQAVKRRDLMGRSPSYMIEESHDISRIEEHVRRMLKHKIDMSSMMMREPTFEWPSIYEKMPRLHKDSEQRRRTGSIPENKRKPHHVFLQDPVKNRRTR